ncbi:Hypothetical predicted protein [Drosophila guanche]|uniref:Uncharacterized protein n=1 Tax=Drosophila guanche TaxID=7266 RepID=A0A3B0JZR9_DROGU|nr:Hypothetical predicted protein [Drosophila guanche]
MAKEVIGKCKYCKREVASDMRPINALKKKVKQKITLVLKDTDQLDQSVLSMAHADKGHNNTQHKGKDCECESRDIIGFTKNILDLVEVDMDGKKNYDDHKYYEHAEAVMNLLHEEDKFMKIFEDQGTPPMAAPAKRGGRRRR